MATTFRKVKNNAGTTLNGAINDSTTTVVVTSAAVLLADGDCPYRITIDSEILEVTGVSSNTLTVATRGSIESTAAASHSDGAVVEILPTAGALTAIHTAINNIENDYVNYTGTPVDNDFAKFTDVNTVEGRSYSEVMGDLSGQAAATFSMNTQKISGVVDPTADQEAATKKYVDDRVARGYSITIENPADGDDIKIGFNNIAITITEIRSTVVGGTSVLWSLYHHTARDTAVASGAEVITAGTTTLTSTTAGDDITAFNDAIIPADRHLVYSAETVTGAVTEHSLTIFYTID